MPKSTKTQIYAICWLHNQNKSIEQISEELKLPSEQVVQVLEKHFVHKNKNVKTGSEPVDIKNKNLMINQTSGKNNPGVAIMTKEASEKADSMRSKTNTTDSNTHKAIYRPKQ